MNVVRFTVDSLIPDVQCPNCKKGLCIDEWLTDYGEPWCGDVVAYCPVCDTEFILNTKVTYTYTSIKIKKRK